MGEAVGRLVVLSRIAVPAHTRVVNGKLVKVDAYVREGGLRDVFEATAYMNKKMKVKTPDPGKAEMRGIMVGTAWIEAWQRDYKKKHFTDDEQEAIRTYGSTGYMELNGYLRGNKDGKDVVPDKPFKIGGMARESHLTPNEIFEHLDAAIEKAPPLPEDITLYRGNKGDEELYEDILDRGNDLKNAVLEDLGYPSTSLAKEVAEGFSRGGYLRSPILFEIHAKKGQKGVYIGGSEAEWVLPRGTKFKIIEVRQPDLEEGFDRATLVVEIV